MGQRDTTARLRAAVFGMTTLTTAMSATKHATPRTSATTTNASLVMNGSFAEMIIGDAMVVTARCAGCVFIGLTYGTSGE